VSLDATLIDAALTARLNCGASSYHVGVGASRKAYLPIVTREVLSKIQRGDLSWEALVPPRIVQIITQDKPFGYQPPWEH
jgi:hypothetical protein